MRRILTVATRASPGPVLVRCGVFVAALAALALALPAEVLAGRLAVLVPLLALWPAVAPRGRGGTAVAVVAVAGWLATTSVYGVPVRLLPLVMLAALLYAGHSLTALAAMLPYDAVVAPEALVRWVSRAALVTVSAVALAVAAIGAAEAAGGGGFLAAAIGGAAAAVGLAALLAWLVRR